MTLSATVIIIIIMSFTWSFYLLQSALGNSSEGEIPKPQHVEQQEALLREVLEQEHITLEDFEAADEAILKCLYAASHSRALTERAMSDVSIARTATTLGSCGADGHDDDGDDDSGGGVKATTTLTGDSMPISPAGAEIFTAQSTLNVRYRTHVESGDQHSCRVEYASPLDVDRKPIDPQNASRPHENDHSNVSTHASSHRLNENMPPAATTFTEHVGLMRGLKHFSLKVAEKVEGLGSTNYNQVADDLVAEMSADAQAGLLDGNFDEKNVRRRVYDALNVLEALDIIDKDKKNIQWRGWPNRIGQSPKDKLLAERARLAARVEFKARNLASSAEKALCLSNLVIRNRDAPMPVLLAAQEQNLPSPNPLALPFMLVHAPSNAEIDVKMTVERRGAELDFHQWPFQVFDDERVMKLMGLNEPHLNIVETTEGEFDQRRESGF